MQVANVKYFHCEAKLGLRVCETKFGQVCRKSLIIADFADYADFGEIDYEGFSESNVSCTAIGNSGHPLNQDCDIIQSC